MLKEHDHLLISVIELPTEEEYDNAVMYLNTIREFQQIVDIGGKLYRMEFSQPEPGKLRALSRKVTLLQEAHEASEDLLDVWLRYKNSNIGIYWAYQNLGFRFAIYYLSIAFWPYLAGIPTIFKKNISPGSWPSFFYRSAHFSVLTVLIYFGISAGTWWVAIPAIITGFTMLGCTAIAYTLFAQPSGEEKAFSLITLVVSFVVSILFVIPIFGIDFLLIIWGIYLLVVNHFILWVDHP